MRTASEDTSIGVPPGGGAGPSPGGTPDDLLDPAEAALLRGHPLDFLGHILGGPSDLLTYRGLLAEAIVDLVHSTRAPFTTEEAYGISATGGVAPVSLVHTNRMPFPQAAVIGKWYGYATEPLCGTPLPCPPGPRSLPPLTGANPVPWVFLSIKKSGWGRDACARYQAASRDEGPVPTNGAL